MPAGGQVYQPTTVSYENHSQWASPAGFLAQNGPVHRAKCVQWVALAIGLIGVAAGLIMIIEGSVDYSDTRQHEEVGNTTPLQQEEEKTDVVIIVIGVLLLLVGFVFLAFYLIITFRRRGCVCFMTKEQRMARALRSPQSVNGQGMNPSTDLLVAAQYAPVSEIAYHPPAVSEEEETRKLMGSDNKDCILKESNSVITLNQDRFEPDDSPLPRRLRNWPPPEQQQRTSPMASTLAHSPNSGRRSATLQPPSDSTNAQAPALTHSPNSGRRSATLQPSPDAQALELVKTPPTPTLPMKRLSSWKTSIMRKASVRSKRAPLAGGEELTPSLRSSWSSVYFNNGEPLDSDLDDAESYSSASV